VLGKGLLAARRTGRIVTWTISLAGALILYLLLLPLVRQVYGRQIREEALQAYTVQLEHHRRERIAGYEQVVFVNVIENERKLCISIGWKCHVICPRLRGEPRLRSALLVYARRSWSSCPRSVKGTR